MERVEPKPPSRGPCSLVPRSRSQLAARKTLQDGCQLPRVRSRLGPLPFIELLRVTQGEAGHELAPIERCCRRQRGEALGAQRVALMVMRAGQREGLLEAPQVHV